MGLYFDPTRIKANEKVSKTMTTDRPEWFDIIFSQNCKANFEVYPSTNLDVDFYAVIGDSPTVAREAISNGCGIPEKIEMDVSAGQRIRLSVQRRSGAGSFELLCRVNNGSMPNGHDYSHLLKETVCYKGNGSSNKLPVFEDEYLTKQMKGYICDGEPVTVKSIKNEGALITYSTNHGTKDAYVPLSHLQGKEYFELYIKQMKARYTPKLVDGWYTYDSWRISQHFNDPTSSKDYLGHLGLDVINIKAPVARAVYPGKVKFAGRSTTNGGKNSANGYVVQIEHIHKDTGIKFYSFYAHLRPESICVSKEQNVTSGEIIGLMGHTNSKEDGGGMSDHTHIGIYSDGLRATGQQWGYFRDTDGKKVTFDKSHGYIDGHIRFSRSTFYNVELWSDILIKLQKNK
ncbi:MAG: M23 family metallopeptidase [Vallitalea sp.]|nr:M23 family metallopeptidase [Vallitalea sp.]